MSVSTKVVWSEGMFLNPQHFQQQERYIERTVQARCAALNAFGWGFESLQIDPQLLKLNKISLSAAAGVFPDGTAFQFPEHDQLPDLIDLPVQATSCVVYLGLPVATGDACESAVDVPDRPLRFRVKEVSVKDSSSTEGELAQVAIGQLKCRLLTETDDRSGYTCLEICRLVEGKSGSGLVLDPTFIAPVMDAHASVAIERHLTELAGLLHQRGEAITARLADVRRGGASELSDYLLLQVINRYQPLVTHLSNTRGQTPLEIYRVLLQMTGEIATFATEERRPPKALPVYTHNALGIGFDALMKLLRQYLASVYEQRAVSLNIETKKYGVSIAHLKDPSLCSSARFVLAVGADLPEEVIRRRCPSHIKLGSVEQIRQLVNAALPGIALSSLAVTPRELPHRNGYCYFELDSRHPMWAQVEKSARLAMHVSGDLPNLVMELWAIRR